jgi:hypothetical protein
MKDMELHLWSIRRHNVGKASEAHPSAAIALTAEEDPNCTAFTFNGSKDCQDTIYLLRAPYSPHFSVEDDISHESLHLTIQREGESKASHLLDRVSNHTTWRELPALGGL